MTTRSALLESEQARVRAALDAGNPLWLVLDGIADDENLEGLKAELSAYARRVAAGEDSIGTPGYWKDAA